MIKKIIINNIAIIDSLEFELSNRLNIVTGETGSGKSIIIKSIQYLKAYYESIQEKFSISKYHL